MRKIHLTSPTNYEDNYDKKRNQIFRSLKWVDHSGLYEYIICNLKYIYYITLKSNNYIFNYKNSYTATQYRHVGKNSAVILLSVTKDREKCIPY